MMRMLHEWPALSTASTGCNNSTGSGEEEKVEEEEKRRKKKINLKSKFF